MEATNDNKIGIILLWGGIIVCLLQIWLPGHYLTCDGPCHLYNARIMHDVWLGHNSALYSKFYNVVYSTDPNSTTTFLLAGLLFVAPAVIAEKLFISLYAILLLIGFDAVLRRLGAARVWAVAGAVFVFTYAFSKGFYNFSLATAFFCWVVWAWLAFLQTGLQKYKLALILFLGLTFFTHLLPFVFAGIVCAALMFSYAQDRTVENRQPFLQNIIVLGYCSLPWVVLGIAFTGKEGGLQLHLGFYPYRLLELVEFKYLINMTDSERIWTTIVGITLTISGFWAAFRMLRRYTLHRWDGMSWSIVFVLLVYLTFPEDFMGRAIIISIRAQIFVYLLLVWYLAVRLSKRDAAVVVGVLLTCFVALTAIRSSTLLIADKALADILSVGSRIPDGATVLNLDNCPNGTDEDGNLIAPRQALFHHAALYLGVDRPLILLANYEANMGYFPVRWKPEMNPYDHLSIGAGIEGAPPAVDLENYHRVSGVWPNAILISQGKPDTVTPSTLGGLSNYSAKFISPGGRTLLLSR